MRPTIPALSLAVVLSLLVGACSDDGGDDAGGSTTTAASSDSSATDGSTTTTATGGAPAGEAPELPDGASMAAEVTYEVDGAEQTSTISSDDSFACNYGNVTDTQWVVNFDTANADPEDGLRTLSGDEISVFSLHLELPADTTSTSGEGTGEAELELGDGTQFFTLDGAEISVQAEGEESAVVSFEAQSNEGAAFRGNVTCGTVE